MIAPNTPEAPRYVVLGVLADASYDLTTAVHEWQRRLRRGRDTQVAETAAAEAWQRMREAWEYLREGETE